MPVVEIYKEFRFEAAHYLPHAPKGHPNARLHGHSFRAVVTLRGEVDPDKGWIRDFAAIEQAMNDMRELLDHNMLNEIEGLATPTLERLAVFIYDGLKPTVPEVAAVGVHRDSCNEGATYRGTQA